MSIAPKAQQEGSQTCNVWKMVDKNVCALKTRQSFGARLQRANLYYLLSQTFARLATFFVPLARLKSNL